MIRRREKISGGLHLTLLKSVLIKCENINIAKLPIVDSRADDAISDR
jgi:hypothetical protein